MSRRWGDQQAPRLADRLTEASILVVPVGAIEQHGPHLPLATDVIVPEAVAAAAVERAAAAGLDVWLLPTVTVSKSDEHAWAPGTLWLSAETLLAVLRDLGRSIAATRARKVVFLNGHGGNAALLQVANRELRRRFDLQPFTMPAGVQRAGGGGDGEPDESGFGIHAGWSETSVLLHLAPDLVDLSVAVGAVPRRLADLDLIGFNARPVSFGWLSDDFDASGVIGDPTGATAQAGAELFAAGVDFVVAALQQVDRFPLAPARDAR